MMRTKIKSKKGEQVGVTVGELLDETSPETIIYSRMKCIKECFVQRVKNSLEK